MFEQRFAALEDKLDDLGSEMRAQGDEIRREIGQLDRNMRVLHEDVIARIADLAPDFAPIRREFKAADAQLRESIEGRLAPLEAAERSRRRPRR